MAKKQAAVKKPQDSTLRNVRAAHTREAKLEQRIARLERQMKAVKHMVRALREDSDWTSDQLSPIR